MSGSRDAAARLLAAISAAELALTDFEALTAAEPIVPLDENLIARMKTLAKRAAATAKFPLLELPAEVLEVTAKHCLRSHLPSALRLLETCGELQARLLVCTSSCGSEASVLVA